MSKAEKFISDCTRNCSNELDYVGTTCKVYQPWFTSDQARKAVEIAREEIYKWLRNNAYKYSTVGFYTDAMIADLRQAMKDE